MRNSRPTQCERVIKYIKDFGSITTLEAIIDLGVLRLASRISELRKNGVQIADEITIVKNRYGEKCHVKKYYFKEQEK
jgi:hypothetical protein